MKIFSQLLILLGFFCAGEFIVKLTGINFPGSILGMILLIIALQTQLLKVKQIKEVCDFFLNNMLIFFLPLGVGLMNQYDIISQNWLPIIASTVLSTFIVMAVVGFILNRKSEEDQDNIS